MNKITKKKDSFGFWFLVFLLPFFVLWKNIFPTNHYYFNRNVGNGLRIIEKEIDGQRYGLVPSERDGLISRLKLEVLFEKEKNSLSEKFLEKKISLAKNYEVSLYPWGDDLDTVEKLREVVFFENSSGIPNGSLVADEKAVYVVSQGKIRPFISPEVFERLGYVWEKISKEENFSQLLLGESLNLQAVHPDGTIFRDEKGEFFIFFQNKKRKVSEELLQKVWPNYFWIDLLQSEPNYFAECSLKKNWQGKDKAVCWFNLKQEKNVANVFLVKIEGLDNQKIEDFRSKAITSIFLEPKKSLRLFVEKTKDRLSIKYGFLRNLNFF